MTPSSRQPLLEAMLSVIAWLVSNLVVTFRTIFNRSARVWHADAVAEALSRLAASSLRSQPNRSWISTFVAICGSCCATPA
jgi:hypothetical protein